MRYRSLFFLALFLSLSATAAETKKPSGVASDGTVTGTLTINGQKFPLTHVYARKREAWPADATVLDVDAAELSCGIIDVIFANAALSEGTIASILQHEYKGSEKTRGVRFVIDGSGKGDWATMFLLESGAVKGYGITQTNGEITGGQRFAGKVSCKNEEVTQVRMFDLTFDTGVKSQYARTETENAKRVPDGAVAEEFLKVLPGEWTIERWVGLGCLTASGKLAVEERISPRAFRGMFSITLSSGEKVEEDVTISLAETKVHFEGGKVRGGEGVWERDVLDFELWQNLLVGNNTTDYVVLRKN
ncbi:MAG TPA: hypothetical protein VKB93_06845 [Thermoanaerobaculia bacterium]|nr:hypothetical protein [Thermoanaerobaculia bacterium]